MKEEELLASAVALMSVRTEFQYAKIGVENARESLTLARRKFEDMSEVLDAAELKFRTVRREFVTDELSRIHERVS